MRLCGSLVHRRYDPGSHGVHVSTAMRCILDDLSQGKLDERIFATSYRIGAVQRYFQRFCKAHDIADAFTPHDLRRTAATRLHSLGIAPHVVEKILNHQMGGVMAVYNRAEYQPERIEGQETWAKSLLSLVGTPAR